MRKKGCGWDKWLAPGQPDGTPGFCSACGLNRTYGDVKRCMLKRGVAGSVETKQTAQKWISISDLSTDAMKLASMVSGKADCIIGVARSGLTPATIVATMLHLPLLVLRESEGDIVDAGHGWRLTAKDYKQPLVIDDTSCTGQSLSRIRKVVEKDGATPKYAVVYYDKQSKEPVDYFVRELPRPHVLEWNIANSVYASQMLWDMDGVICEDCPNYIDDDDNYEKWLPVAMPKCLPRRSKVRIVTGRREKWRPQTEAWLAKHGVVAELIMHPDGERTGKSVIEHKAAAVLKYATGPVAMLESDARQARRIQEITGKAIWYVNDEPPVAAAPEVKRMDWAAEYPCVHRGEVQAEGSCGCAGVDKIPVYACNETNGAQCVVLKSNQGRLLRKDGKWSGLRACEDCPLICPELSSNTLDSAAVLSVKPDNRKD